MAKVYEVPEGYHIVCLQKGNFTVALLQDDKGNTVSFHFSKRNPRLDDLDVERGKEIASRRALKEWYVAHTPSSNWSNFIQAFNKKGS